MFIHTANIVRKPKKTKTKNVHKKYKNYPPKFSINHCTKKHPFSTKKSPLQHYFCTDLLLASMSQSLFRFNASRK